MVDLETELRARILSEPKQNGPSPKAKILSMLGLVDRRLAKLLIDRPAGEGLTSEAIARKKSNEALKPPADDDSLEQKFLKKSREMKSTMRLVPSPIPTPKPMTDLPAPIHIEPSAMPETVEDPNL